MANPTDDALAATLLALPSSGVGPSNPSAGVDADGHAAVLHNFLTALDTGSPLDVDRAQSRKAVAIIRAIYASSAQGGAAVGLA